MTQSYRWARSRALGGIVVLGYHRLDHGGDDPFDIAVPASDFAEHIALIARRARVITLRDAVNALAARRMPSRSLVVTFDDGYADTVADVLPLLERHGIPATIFITTGTPGRQFWWDDLAGVILRTPLLPARLELQIHGVRRTWIVSEERGSVDAPRARRKLLLSLASVLREMGAAEREDCLDQLKIWSQCEPTPDAAHRALTEAEIEHLAASRLIEVGAHTVTHPLLPSLQVDEQLEEMAASRRRLEELTGTEVTSFSYPHGAYTGSTLGAVRRAGFTAACCSTPDVLTPRSDVFALPRLWVRPGGGAEFDRWLNRWLVS